MAQSGSRAMTIVATVLGLVMAGSGMAKLAGESHQAAMFAMVGLPRWFLALVGTFEIIGGAFLALPPAAPLGSVILSTIMVGAFWTHVAYGEWTKLVPVTVLLVLFLFIFRRNQFRAVQLLGGA